MRSVQQHERRHRQHDERHTGDDEHLLAPELIGQMPHAEDERHVRDQADSGDQRRFVRRHHDHRLQVDRQVRENHVEAHRVQHGGTEGDDELLRVMTEQVADRMIRVVGLGDSSLHLLIRRRILQLGTNVVSDETQRSCQQERDAPAPLVHGCVRQDRVHDRGERRAHQQAHGRRSRHERAVHAALVRGSVLSQERSSAGILAGSRETLDHAEQQQQDGGGEADGQVARQQADAEGSAGHQEDGRGQGPLAALLVAHAAPEDGADGAQQERKREHRERLHERKRRVVAREEHVGDDHCEVRIGCVVEPFDEVPKER